MWVEQSQASVTCAVGTEPFMAKSGRAMVSLAMSIPNRDATESCDRDGEGRRRRLIPLPVRRVWGHDVLRPRLRDGRLLLTPVHSSAMHSTRSTPVLPSLMPATDRTLLALENVLSLIGFSVGKVETGKGCDAFFAISAIDSPNHVRTDDSTKPNARRDAVVFEADILK